MRHRHLGLLLLATAGCNKAGFEATTIRPTFGWQDGCASVMVSGHGFGESVSATVGGQELTDVVRPDDDPDVDEDEQDKAFFFFGTVAAADEPGPADVVVTSDDKESTIPDGYYYVACAAPATLDGLTPEDGIVAGDSISIFGCGIDVGTMQVRIVDPAGAVATATAALTADCGTAYASFTAPTLVDGTYDVYVVCSAAAGCGTDIAEGDILNPVTGDPIECALDSAADCDAPLTITYGVAP